MSSERGGVVAGLKSVLAADGLRLVARGLVILLLTRYLLDPAQYGSLFLAKSVLGIAVLFSTLGIAKSAARFVTEYRERAPGQIPHVMRLTLGYNLLTTVVVVAALVAGAEAIAALVGQPSLAGLLTVGAGYVVGRTLVTYSYLLFQGFNSVHYSAVVRGVESVSQFAFVVGFVAMGLATTGAMLGYVAATLVAAGVGLVVLARRFYRRYDAADREDGLGRRVLRYGVPLTATKGANVIDKKVDTVLVGALVAVNPGLAVAYYTLARQIVGFVIAPARAVGFTVSPSFGEDKAGGDLDRAARTYRETLEYVLLLYLPAAVGIVLVARPAVRFVFGAQYLGAVPVLQVLAGYVVLQSITAVTSDGLDFLGRARARAIGKGTTALANLGLNVALIPTYGAVGAAAATVATHSVYVAINVGVVHRELDLPLAALARTVGKVVGVTALVAVVVVALMPFVSNLAALVGVVAVAVAAWATTAVASGLLDPDRVADLL